MTRLLSPPSLYCNDPCRMKTGGEILHPRTIVAWCCAAIRAFHGSWVPAGMSPAPATCTTATARLVLRVGAKAAVSILGPRGRCHACVSTVYSCEILRLYVSVVNHIHKVYTLVRKLYARPTGKTDTVLARERPNAPAAQPQSLPYDLTCA
jgi:hypothetical protein